MPSPGVECRTVKGIVDQEQVVFVLPGLHFFTSAIHVVVPPALGVAVEIAHHEHVGVFHTDGVERQRLVVGAVEVQEFKLRIANLEFQHLIF